jgi:hypothetical protein
MNQSLTRLLNFFWRNPRTLFAVDGMGALTTAFMLALVLVWMEDFFKFPIDLLYKLAGLACVFALYSLTCFFAFPRNGRPYLLVIAYANLGYCILTLTLVAIHLDEIAVWSVVYFVSEVSIVALLALLEIRTARRKA